MKAKRINHQLPLFKTALLVAAVIFNGEVYSQGGAKWSMNGNSNVDSNSYAGTNTSYDFVMKSFSNEVMRLTTFGYAGIGTPHPTHRLTVSGGFRTIGNAYVDSLLTALEVQTGGLTTGILLVTGNSQFNGIVNVGSTLILDGTNSSISSTTGTVDFLNSDIITTGSINASQYLLNGMPLVTSQWTSSGSNIYFSGGNVGINTSNPAFPLEVDGNVAVTGTIFTDRLSVQKAMSIGQFRFINGASQPGHADSICTSSRLVIESNAESVSFIADTIRMGNVRFIKESLTDVIESESRLNLKSASRLELVSGAEKVSLIADTIMLGNVRVLKRAASDELRATQPLTITSNSEKIALASDTVTVKERMGIGVERPTVALDVVGDIHTSGVLKSGNSIYIAGLTPLTTSNIIFADDGEISFSGGTPTTPDLNNIKVGIGTNFPSKALHVLTAHATTGPLPRPVPLTGSHYGIRLEDHTTSNLGTTISIWDLEPRGGNLIIGTPGDPMLTLSNNGTYIFHDLADLTPPIAQYRTVVVNPVGQLTVMPFSGPLVSWKTEGNETIDDNVNFIGPTNGAELVIKTGDESQGQLAERMRINTLGVGIGTDDPQKKLHIKTEHEQIGHYGPAPGPCWLQVPPTCAPPLGLPNLSHGGIRLEDNTSFINQNDGVVFTSNLTKWDIVPKFHALYFEIPSSVEPVMILTEQGLIINGTFNLNDGNQQAGYVLTSDFNGNASWQAMGNAWTRPGGNRMHTTHLNDNVGIGETSPQAKLHIKVNNASDVALAVYQGSTENFRIQGDGKFFARAYKIKLGGFPDYVFHKDHKRMSYDKRAMYYLKHGRMPLMASAEEVKKEGLDVGNTLIGLTFNIEEIALNQNDLYKMAIKQKQEIELLKKEIELLKNK